MLEWNVVSFCYMMNYVSMHDLVQSIPIFIMCMFMGLVSQVDSMSVASSSSVRGLGMLQCGIRPSLQHGPQWPMKRSDRGRVHLS